MQVGFGDVLPGNASEKIYAMFAMILGTTVFAYAMSSMGQLIGTLNAAGAQAAAKFKVRGVQLRRGRRVWGAQQSMCICCACAGEAASAEVQRVR